MFSRRDFLKGALAAGGIVASSRLPLHAEELFSPTAKLYVVAGNFVFAGREVLVT